MRSCLKKKTINKKENVGDWLRVDACFNASVSPSLLCKPSSEWDMSSKPALIPGPSRSSEFAPLLQDHTAQPSAPAGLHRADLATDAACHEPLWAIVVDHGAPAAHLPARGHMEPDLGPLGLHPLSPVCASAPASTVQFRAPGCVLTSASSPGHAQWTLKDGAT